MYYVGDVSDLEQTMTSADPLRLCFMEHTIYLQQPSPTFASLFVRLNLQPVFKGITTVRAQGSLLREECGRVRVLY